MSDDYDNCLSAYPVVTTLPVAWGDQDSFGHVNNTVYLRWCESARIDYLERVGLWQMHSEEGIGPILANISCDYRRVVTYPDTVRVGSRVVRIGNSSFRMDHLVISEATGGVAAAVESTIVVLDYNRGATVRVPDPIREAIARVENGG